MAPVSPVKYEGITPSKSLVHVFFSRGKRHAKRWYHAIDTKVKDGIDPNTWAGFDASMPAEWESWLRHRRDKPPTEVKHFAATTSSRNTISRKCIIPINKKSANIFLDKEQAAKTKLMPRKMPKCYQSYLKMIQNLTYSLCP